MLHLPLLRIPGGKPYRSLDVVTLPDVRTGEPAVEVSQANPGVISHDLLRLGEARKQLEALPVAELIAICRRAGKSLGEEELPVGHASDGSGEAQSPERYLQQLSSTTGMPLTLGRRNLGKIRWVLENMEAVLGGLTRGLDLSILDTGLPGAGLLGSGTGAARLGYQAQTDGLGAVLPGNSPGVHSLWLPAVALKIPLILKPGREEPWTPYRVTQALIAAGCPPAALGFYPTDHAGSSQILLRCGRSLLFGDGATVRPWAADKRVEIHGPGWSKVILGKDQAADWEPHLELLVSSIAENGGRSCINASGVWVAGEAGQGRRLAEALAARLAEIEPRPLDDPEAAIAAFPNRKRAHQISEWLDRQLQVPGAVDLTAEARAARGQDRARVAEVGGCTFLRPTLVWCEDPEHPLAGAELLFPFASVVEVPQAEIARRIGSTLVASVVTEDEAFAREMLACPTIDRLNLGPIPTCRISWDQPHEGNLFEHLYKRRALEVAA